MQDERVANGTMRVIERELLRAAGQETTPRRARRRVLSALGLLVLLPRAGAKMLASGAVGRHSRWCFQRRTP